MSTQLCTCGHHADAHLTARYQGADETTPEHAHEWEYILLRPGKLGAECLDICKCGMYRIRLSENG